MQLSAAARQDWLQAAWFKSQGFSVTLCDTKEQFAELSELEKQGTICLEGALNLTEPIQIDEITTDISRAILDKQYILVCCSATRQKEISSLIAPVLQNGQAIVFSPGNLGTLYLRQELEVLNQKRTESKRQTEIILAELSGNLWACRKAKGTVVVARPLGVQRIAACPASDLERAMGSIPAVVSVETGPEHSRGCVEFPQYDHASGRNTFKCDRNRKKGRRIRAV